MSGHTKIVGAAVGLGVALCLVAGCFTFGAAAARRRAAEPEPSKVRTTTAGCLQALAAHDDTVFWIEDERIMAWQTQRESTPRQIAEDNDPRSIAANDVAVYWVDGEEPRAVRMLNRNGGGVRRIATVGDRTTEIAADAEGVYWISSEVARGSVPELWTADTAGADPKRIGGTSRYPRMLTLAGDFAYWISREPFGERETVQRLPRSGGEAESVVELAGSLNGFVADERGIMYVDAQTLAVYAANGDGSDLVELTHLDQMRSPLVLAGGDALVYGDEGLRAISRTDGRVRTTAAPVQQADHIEVTAARVFTGTATWYPHEGCFGSELTATARSQKG